MDVIPTIKALPDYIKSTEVAFNLLAVDDGPDGNPHPLISWRDHTWKLTRTDSNYMQAVYTLVVEP